MVDLYLCVMYNFFTIMYIITIIAIQETIENNM